MIPASNHRLTDVHRQKGICLPTFYAWKKPFRDQGFVVPSKPRQADRWDAKAKLAALMNEVERYTYSREDSLYVEQLDAWKRAFEPSDASVPASGSAALMAERRRSHQLEKELRRKEQALEEAGA